MRAALPRLPDWTDRLAAYLEARSVTTWAWGAHDCCQFSGGALEALCGVDIIAPILAGRGYASPMGAARVLRALDGIETLPARAGLPELTAVAQAARGDIVLAPVGRRGALALGVVADHRAAFAAHPAGLHFFPLSRCVGAWRA